MGGERKSRQRARAKGWKRSRDRDEGRKEGKGGGRHGRIKDREVEKKNKRVELTDSGFSLCSSGDDDGFNEATVNCHSVSPSPTDTQKYTQSGGEIDLKSGGSVLTRPLFYSSFPPTIVITYQRATCVAGTGGFNITLEPQQVFSPKDQISDCCLTLDFADQFSERISD